VAQKEHNLQHSGR